MTEVPEYLLERSRARRAALGLAPTGGAQAPSGEQAPEGGEPAPAAAGAVATTAPAPAAAAAAPAAPAATPEPETPPAPVFDRGPRSGVPFWMMPVIVMLPLWAIVYMGAFGQRGAEVNPAAQGAALYQSAGCGGCHGSSGGGGVGPKLSGGEVKLTFPDPAAHIAFVKQGSGPVRGQPYGDPNRPGGAHVAKSGGMPSFAGQLSDEEIAAVVEYERGL